MKKGQFYILITGYNTQLVNGYIFETSRNKYGIHNRITDGSGKAYTVTDLASGIACSPEYRTIKAAEAYILNRPALEDKIIEQHNDKNNDFMQKSLATIAEAYQAHPITDEKRRPIKHGYIIEEYPTNDGTNTTRAQISPAAHPNCIYMDIPEADLVQIMQQIKKDNPKAYFIDKATGEEIVLLSAKQPQQEPKRNRIPRKYYKLHITILKPTSASAAGDRATIFKDEYNRIIMETESGKRYLANMSLLRSADLVRIDRIETEAPQEAPTSPATDEGKESTTDAPTTPQSATEGAEKLYKYGMRTRGYSIGAQPAGVVSREDDPSGKYYDIISYKEPLTAADIDHYSLDALTPQEAPAADEAEQIPTETAGAPQGATERATTGTDGETPTPANGAPENGTQAAQKRYIFRTYTDWTVYAGRLSEEIITAATDEEAQQIAIKKAAGLAFTCNRMEEGQTARELYGDDSEQIITTDTEDAPTIDAENAPRTDASPAPNETPTNGSKRAENAPSARTQAERPTEDATTHGSTTPRGDPQSGRPTADHQQTSTAARRAPPFFKKPIIPATPHRKNDFEKPISVFGQIPGQVIDRPYNPREAGGLKNETFLASEKNSTLKIAYSYLVGNIVKCKQYHPKRREGKWIIILRVKQRKCWTGCR